MPTLSKQTRTKPRIAARQGLGIAALLLLPLSLTACSANDSGSSDSSAPKKASTPADPNAGLLTGTKLKTLLLPASALPKGFTKSSDGARDSGDSFGPASSATVAPDKACEMLMSTGWIQASGIESASFAQNDYADSYSNQFAQEIDTFRGSDAKTVMAHLSQVFTKCATFEDNSDQGKAAVKITSSPVTGLGDEAVKAVMTSPAWDGGETMVAARVGKTVVTTFYSSSESDKGEAVMDLTKQLVSRVEAAG